MKFRNYIFIFLIELIYITISMIQPSYVQASEIVFEEIEKFVSPTEEMQIDEPVQPNLSQTDENNTEEEPVSNDEKPDGDEGSVKDEETIEEKGTIENTEAVEEQTIPVTPQITEKKQNDFPVKSPQADEYNPVKTVSEEIPVTEKESKINLSLLSKFFNKCADFFSKLSFDKIIALKETINEHLFPNKTADIVCCRQITEHKQVVNKKDFLPYYFLYPLPINNLLEKIYITNKITNPAELLPYSYITKNYEVRLEVPEKAVTPQGTTDIRVLLNAPSPEIEVVGKSLYAKLVVDIRNNILYKYDEDGFPLKAYLVATGARGTRTKAGLRIVTYKEKFPYKGAPINTKRILDPYPYGPYIIFLNAVNPKTGKQMYVDQFLHGNGNEKSIGRKVSHGCMRTNNNVMKNELSKEVNRGDYVLLINPDLT